MRVHWHQFSPGEKEALVRHYILHRSNTPVTAQAICEAMQPTHFLSCVGSQGKASVVGFVSTEPGVPAGIAVSEDLTEGIYMAALRASGVDLMERQGGVRRRPTRRAD